VKQGLVEYVPMSAARVPESDRAIGRIVVDVAFIQVSLPDEFGFVSLGVSVDVIPAAVAKARLVIAEVNPAMPRSMGDSTLHLNQIHHLVPVDVPVIEYHHEPVREDAMEQIARYIGGIIDDGSTLQIGLGRVTNEALKYLADRGHRHPQRGGHRRHHPAAGKGHPDRALQDAPAGQDRHQLCDGQPQALRPDRPQPAVLLSADGSGVQPGHAGRAAQDGVGDAGLCGGSHGPGLR
jgi:hypothetical protein